MFVKFKFFQNVVLLIKRSQEIGCLGLANKYESHTVCVYREYFKNEISRKITFKTDFVEFVNFQKKCLHQLTLMFTSRGVRYLCLDNFKLYKYAKFDQIMLFGPIAMTFSLCDDDQLEAWSPFCIPMSRQI